MALFIHRGKNRGRASYDGGSLTTEMDSQPSGSAADAGDIYIVSGSGKVGQPETEGGVLCLQDRLKWLEKHDRKVVLFSKAYPCMIFCGY